MTDVLKVADGAEMIVVKDYYNGNKKYLEE